MTNLTPEIIESATLNTPYYIDKSFSTDEGVNVAAICDVNGFHVFDCFECDAEELIKRINGYEQQAETIELLKHGMKGDYDLDQWLDWAVSKKHMMETIERLNSRNKRLLSAMNTMRDDLLLGAPEAEDGTIFINVKRDVWEYFCAVIDNTENILEAG